jgi:hypothetical protein
LKKEEGRRKKEEGRRKKEDINWFLRNGQDARSTIYKTLLWNRHLACFNPRSTIYKTLLWNRYLACFFILT